MCVCVAAEDFVFSEDGEGADGSAEGSVSDASVKQERWRRRRRRRELKMLL